MTTYRNGKEDCKDAGSMGSGHGYHWVRVPARLTTSDGQGSQSTTSPFTAADVDAADEAGLRWSVSPLPRIACDWVGDWSYDQDGSAWYVIAASDDITGALVYQEEPPLPGEARLEWSVGR